MKTLLADRSYTRKGKIQTKIGLFGFSYKMRPDGYQLETLLVFIPKKKVTTWGANQVKTFKDECLWALGFRNAPTTSCVFIHRF